MQQEIPFPPDSIWELSEKCENKDDYFNLLFEWYRYTAQLCLFSAHIDTRNFPEITVVHYGTLVGLLSRISRLMLNNMKLSCEKVNGETTAIIDRCIIESAIKLMWLSNTPSKDKFNIFLADGLKNDIKLKNDVNNLIKIENRMPSPIEIRMLNSIENYIKESELTESEIHSTRKLPDLSSMLKQLKFHDIYYRCLMTMGAHSVHGTWSSLKKDYIILEPNKVVPKDSVVPTHLNQYISVLIMVLSGVHFYYGLLKKFPFTINILYLLEEYISEIKKISSSIEFLNQN